MQEYAEAAQARASPCYGRPRYFQKRIRSVTVLVDVLLICPGYLRLSTGFQLFVNSLVIERVVFQQT